MAAGPHRRLRRPERGGGPVRISVDTVRAAGRGVMQVDLGDLGFEEGGALLVKRALRRAMDPGGQISVSGSAPEFELHLRTWCRAEGHQLLWQRRVSASECASEARITAGPRTVAARWTGAERAGSPDPSAPQAVAGARAVGILGTRGTRGPGGKRLARVRVSACRQDGSLVRRCGAALRSGRRGPVGPGDRDSLGRGIR